MDVMTTSMAMAMSTTTKNSLMSSAPTTAPVMSMPGMDMGASSNCKSSMFWNWDTLDACFLSTTWHITSKGMFAGSCIGVIALVLLLEFLRRLQREYDRLIQQHATKPARVCSNLKDNSNSSVNTNGAVNAEDPPNSAVSLLGGYWERSLPLKRSSHVATVFQQAVRAGIYTLQFFVAYMIMLLAMYYNGYILVCIFIGAFIGFFFFSWDASGAANVPSSGNAACCA